MYCVEESACDIVGIFRRPPAIRRPGHCGPLVLSLRHAPELRRRGRKKRCSPLTTRVCISAIKRILYTTAMYTSWSSFVYLRFHFSLLRCMLKSSRFACGSEDVTQYNTIQFQLTKHMRTFGRDCQKLSVIQRM